MTLPPRDLSAISAMPRGLAVLVNYRNAGEIIAAVAALRADAPLLPIVVVDNSEQDAEAQALRHGLPAGVHLCIADSNLGFGRACNLGLAHYGRTADWVFLVNPDVRVQPGCVAALLAALAADPGLAAVAPRQYLDQQRQWLLPPSWLPTALRAWVTERCLRDPQAARRYSRAARAEWLRLAQASAPQPQRALSGGAVLLRCRDLEAVGGLFDPRFFMYFEDSDLCLRLRRHGRRLAVVPQAEAVHLWAHTPQKGPLMAEGAAVYFGKHYPPPDRWQQRAARLAAQPWAQPLLGPASTLTAAAEAWSPEWTTGWLCELSPSPLMIPATGCFGHGPLPGAALAARHLHEIQSRFPGAPLYGRIGPLTESVASVDSANPHPAWRYFHLPPS